MGRRAYRRNAKAIISELMEADFNQRAVIRRRYASAPLLIIDDFQERDMRPAGEAELSDLIDTRYSDRLPLVLSLNLKPDDLPDNLGPRNYRRVAETGGIIDITWPAIESLRPSEET
jgi:DNA replication protein DnaC